MSVLASADGIVYYPYMASIVGKKRGNATYYYLVESARVGGQPRIVLSSEYLGPADEIIARLRMTRPGAGPARTHASTRTSARPAAAVGPCSSGSGRRRTSSTTATWAPAGADAGRLGRHLPGLSDRRPGRPESPRSKRAFAEWWAKTAGDGSRDLPAAALDHRRFWDAMDQISQRRSWRRSSGGSWAAWWRRSGWTCRGWCWT